MSITQPGKPSGPSLNPGIGPGTNPDGPAINQPPAWQPKAEAMVRSRQETGLDRAIADSLILAGRHLLRLTRLPIVIVSVVLFPILFFGCFVLALSSSMASLGIDYAQYLLPVINLQAMFFTSLGAALTLANDLKIGMIQRCKVMPLARISVLAGLVLAYWVRAIAATTLLLLLAAIFGFRFLGGPLALLGYYALVLLFVTTNVAGYVGLAFWLKQAKLIDAVGTIPYAPLLLMSSGFSPVENFPSWLQPVVRYQPVSVTTAALRSLVAGNPDIGAILGSVLWLGSLLAIFSLLSDRLYRRVV